MKLHELGWASINSFLFQQYIYRIYIPVLPMLALVYSLFVVITFPIFFY